MDILADKIKEIKQDVERHVQIELLRELTLVALSRLKTLDPDRNDEYDTAMQALQ